MKPIKNKKRIDPRYFLDETMIKEEPESDILRHLRDRYPDEEEYQSAASLLGDPGLPKTLAKGTWGRSDEDVDKLAMELHTADWPGADGPMYYDAYLQTAKEILLGHPDGMNHRGPVEQAMSEEPGYN